MAAFRQRHVSLDCLQNKVSALTSRKRPKHNFASSLSTSRRKADEVNSHAGGTKAQALWSVVLSVFNGYKLWEVDLEDFHQR